CRGVRRREAPRGQRGGVPRDARALRRCRRAAGARPVTRAARCLALLGALAFAVPALAPRLSPAFFGLAETAPNTFDVQWKVSISGGLAAVLEPQVPKGSSLTGGVLPC